MTPTNAIPDGFSRSHPVAAATRRRRSRMILIAGGVALLGVCMAIFAGNIGARSAENTHSNQVFGLVIAGACCVIWIPLACLLYTRSARVVDRVANSSNALARWTYSAEERALFVSRERERLRWKRKDTFVALALFGVLGIVICAIGELFYRWGFTMDLVIFAFAALFGLLIYIVNLRTLAQLPEKFSGEVIIGGEGVLTALKLSGWGTREAQLIEAVFIPGEPGEMQFKIRRITQSQEGTSTTVEDLRVPVPGGHDDEARNLPEKLMPRV